MPPQLRIFLGFPAQSRRLLIEAAVVLVLVKFLLQGRTFGRVASWTKRLRCPHRGPSATASQLAEAVVRVSRHLPGMENCLVQALAVQALLGRYRHPGRLCLGAHRDPDGAFVAHAWVEHQGRVLVGHLPTLVHYQPFADRPAGHTDRIQGEAAPA